jgi:hypothetical protein
MAHQGVSTDGVMVGAMGWSAGVAKILAPTPRSRDEEWLISERARPEGRAYDRNTPDLKVT